MILKFKFVLFFLLAANLLLTAQPSTTVPVVQNRDKLYDWQQRHEAILALNKENPPRNVIMGNSIIHYWAGLPKGPVVRGADSWNEYLEPLGLRNMGFGWDKIENVLWRVQNGELDGYAAKHVVLMIGTNNLGDSNDKDIIEGLTVLVKAVRQHQPAAKIILSGVLPRRKQEERIFTLNKAIKKLARKSHVVFINPGLLFLNKQNKIDEQWFVDGLHPNAAGYRKIAPLLAGYLKD
ncbi:MAG: hypothetical protein J7539_00100 [Niabella sp.]|nr:hypothetical protein [Niabella sp.]